jgi:RNA polymerase sigma factor (sigma-70 family)
LHLDAEEEGKSVAGSVVTAAFGWPDIYQRLARSRTDPDPVAYAALRSRVYAWARRNLSGRGWHVIEDVVEEASASAIVNIDRARGPDTFEGFVRGHFLNARRRMLPEDRPNVVPLTDDLDLSDPSESGAVDGLEPEERRQLHSALAALPERERRALELYYLEELCYASVGVVLGVTEEHARQIASRARAHVRRYLEDEGWTSAQGRYGPPGERVGIGA